MSEIGDLKSACRKQLELMEQASVGLVINAKWPKQSDSYTLFGVKGSIVEERDRRQIYALFPARELLDQLSVFFPDEVSDASD